MNAQEYFAQKFQSIKNGTYVRKASFVPLPEKEWPIWAKAIALLRSPTDKGLGDTTLRLYGPDNSDKFKKWFQSTFNRSCGCAGRQNAWNQIYSYRK